MGLSGAAFAVQLGRARNEALAEAERRDKVTRFFLEKLEHAAEDAEPAEKSRLVQLMFERGVKDARALSQDPTMDASVLEGLSGAYQHWGELSRA